MTTDAIPPINRFLSCNSCGFGKLHSRQTSMKTHANVTTARPTPIRLGSHPIRRRNSRQREAINQRTTTDAKRTAQVGTGPAGAGGKAGCHANRQLSGQTTPAKSKPARMKLPIRVSIRCLMWKSRAGVSPPTRDANRSSRTASANGGASRRLVGLHFQSEM